MSAFLQSGRFDWLKTADFGVRFRHQPVVRYKEKPRHEGEVFIACLGFSSSLNR
jgi:hypothetical protein